MRIQHFAWLAILLAISACATTVPPCPSVSSGDKIYVTDEGWHVEIGIPANELDKNLAFYRKIYPGARVIMFGYGKKTFFVAPPKTVSEYILGPVPGPALIHTVGLRVTPLEAYPTDETRTIMLPQGGAAALSEYIWNDLEKDAAGKPVIAARSTKPDGLFYAAKSGYNLLHTCNTWVADALQTAGVPIEAKGVVFSDQLMKQAEEIQCPVLR